MPNPYETLDVARDATEADIKKAYRKLAKQLHPDRNKDNPAAADRFSRVTNAYDLLTDKDKRARFDRGEIDGDGNPAAPFGFGGAGGRAGSPRGGFQSDNFDFGTGGAAGSPDMSDIFEGLFGGGAARGRRGGFTDGFGSRQPPQKGASVQYRLQVPFTDAATRKSQRITLGDGSTIDLKLPSGVESGTQMRLSGKGQPGPGGAGDALVTIEVQDHPFFHRDGDDVRLSLPVTLKEAVQGGSIRIPTVDKAVVLKVAKGTSSGRTLRLKGKGFARKDGSFGDQLVTLVIDIPGDDAALIQFVEHWDGGGLKNPRAELGV